MLWEFFFHEKCYGWRSNPSVHDVIFSIPPVVHKISDDFLNLSLTQPHGFNSEVTVSAFSLALPKEKAWQKERLVVGESTKQVSPNYCHGGPPPNAMLVSQL